jgi:hypothetical protein
MKLFDESQCGFVFADVKSLASRTTWLKFTDFQNCAVKLQFVFGRNHLQADGLGFAGFGRPVQKLHLGIARRDALGIDRTPRVVHDLQKQQFRTAGFQRNLRTQSQDKRLIQACGGRKAFLRLGDETGHQYGGNQKSRFHDSRLNAKNLIDMRK